MCPNDYVLHACSARSNLMGQFCVDTILVTTLGIAESTAAAGGNSKKSMGWWRSQKVDKTIIQNTISDICKFVTDECCSVDGKFFNHESELATEPKYKSLRNWRTELKMKDYKLPDLF